MKKRLSPRNLKLLIPGCGILGLLLRLLIGAVAIDEKGLLITWHPALIALWVLTAAAAVALVLGTRTIRGPEAYRECFPFSIPAAVGCALAVFSAASAVTAHFDAGPIFTGAPNLMGTVTFYMTGVLMALASAAFILAALGRLNGWQPNFLIHVVICVYFALKLLNLYQTWSFDPQVYDYCFQLFACIALTMTAYQLACFDLNKGNHRKLWRWSLAAAFLCCLCIAENVFFLAGALWSWTSLSTLRRPRQRRTMEAETPAAE